MWLICGTVPEADFALSLNTWSYDVRDMVLRAEGHEDLAVNRGTPALLAALIVTCQTLDTEPPVALLVGDTGSGKGSGQLYEYLSQHLSEKSWDGITFHYLFPDVDGHNRVLMALQELDKQPLLVADAGFMYVAKMSGYADSYDLFTPDLGEMAFLADEKAPHPFYTRGFLLSEDENVEKLIKLAYEHRNCAKHLLVKGKVDYMVSGQTITATVSTPHVPHMEPIGGTGDLVTGLVSGYLSKGFEMSKACFLAAKTNRLLGELAKPTPATQVAELLEYLPQAIYKA